MLFRSSAAEANRTNVATLHAKRGTIYDRNGNVLAMSIDCSTVYCNPQNVHDPSGLATILANILGGDYNDYLTDVTADTTFIYIKRQVDDDVVKKLKDKLSESDIEGIYYLDDTKRVYPYDGTCGQILGAVGTDGQGLTGLELQYEDVLTGVDGEMIMAPIHHHFEKKGWSETKVVFRFWIISAAFAALGFAFYFQLG